MEGELPLWKGGGQWEVREACSVVKAHQPVSVHTPTRALGKIQVLLQYFWAGPGFCIANKLAGGIRCSGFRDQF